MRKQLFLLCALLSVTFATAQDVNMDTSKKYIEDAKSSLNDYAKKDYYGYAVPYLKAAVKEGFGEAAYLLGDILWNNRDGKGGNRLVEARSMFTKAIELGYDKGEIELGDMNLWGIGGKEDDNEAFKLYSTANDKGQKEARYRMAMCYFYGWGVETDTLKAYEMSKDYLRKCGVFNYNKLYPDIVPPIATRQIYHMIAQFAQIGKYPFFNNGFIEIKNYNGRLAWAAYLLYISRVPNWIYNAARIMYNTKMYRAKPEDIGLEVFIYETLIDAINSVPDKEKQTYAYFMYADYGERVAKEKNSELQYQWGMTKDVALIRAAEGGYVPAMHMLGDWYEQGNNVSKNLVKAKYWHDKAAAAKATAEQKAKMDSIAANSPIFKSLSDIQCPKTLIMTNNSDVNMRQQPNTKAKKIGSISRDVVYGVIDEQNGWYKVQYCGYDNSGQEAVKTGWVSSTVTHKTMNNPITADMQNDAYGYVDYQEEGAECDQAYINRIYIRPDSICVACVGNCSTNGGYLYLGRCINNVCCFKYEIHFSCTPYYDDSNLCDSDVSLVKNGNAKTGFWVSKNILDGEEYVSILYGSDYAIKLKDSDFSGGADLNLKVFDSDSLLEMIFAKAIKANKITPYYINSALLSGKYISNH